MSKLKEIITWMESLRDEKNIAGMKRFGIETGHAMGISMPVLRQKAKELGHDHTLAEELWDTEIHEARILASLVADPRQTSPELMDRWCEAFDSWDLCDQCCINLFRHTPHADAKIHEWASREEEFVRRAAFALIAARAVGDKKATDEELLPYFTLIVNASEDKRNFVRKAVNWALRQLGKRNLNLYMEALKVSEELMISTSLNAQWIGKDATEELTSEKVVARIR